MVCKLNFKAASRRKGWFKLSLKWLNFPVGEKFEYAVMLVSQTFSLE